MLRGLYTAASGMLVRVLQQERLANDLANINTAGYKADRTVTASFPELLLARLERGAGGTVGTLGTGAVAAEGGIDFSPGPLVETGRRTDLALQGAGFFVVAGPGGPAYTRAGQFQVGPDGRLQTPDGWTVLSAEGTPIFPGTDDFRVTEDGRVLVNDVLAGVIGRVTFANPAGLRKIGANLFVPTPASGPAVDAATPVRQGYLEQSNVDPARAVVEMLSNFRAFEAAQKVLQAQDQTLGLAVNEVGRVDR
ncbi:MAG TPA: flagellar hook-basal body protein [Thermaerobacter sp.]